MNMYEDANTMTREAMDNAMKSLSAMTKGFQQITSETADFTKRSYEQQTAMIEKLLQAKTVEKSIEVQNEYAKTAYENWIAQMNKVSEIYTGIAKDTYRPFEQTASMALRTGTKAAQQTAANAEAAMNEQAAA
ncbi:phasin family protein [Aurantimonas sp. VKM B-3413]|uniref:phasin family protein n=1 Tax=Aurantimonas sp. VKM B-3413 TaxID=2779401 RepID=UPI001E59E20F|nr:phasin family protein [Aurantimonas sp. VKM B-3413]MCB8840439.1 phasin family protein [Aurantimonas sp. VKM B-3413]